MPNPNRRTSVVFPIILITIGGLFLYRSWHPEFDPWPILGTYWPLILVFIGLGRMVDYVWQRQASNDPNAAPVGRGFSVGSTVAALAFVVVIVILLWHGSGSIRARTGRSLSHENHTVDAQGAKSVHASIKLGSGDLTIGGDTSHLLDGSFDFRASRGTPDVSYNVSNGIGELTVEEERTGPDIVVLGNNHANWNLRFGDQLPLDMDVNLGAGEGKLNLRGLPLNKLDLNIGAGRVDADLTGPRTKDLDVDISGGVGEAVIRLPRNVGVVADVSGGIGSIDTPGLKEDGGQYFNDAYGHTPATIHLHVSGGVGSIRLVLEAAPR